jgi:hypothetical protein
MKTKLMDSSAWIDTKKIIGFDVEKKENLNLKTKRMEKNIEYQVIVPGKILLVSKSNYFALMDIWRNER